MSENENRGTRNYSKYDSMSTEELYAIVRLEDQRADGSEMDTDELFYILEVLTQRRLSDPETAGKTTEEAFETFKKHYMPKTGVWASFPTWLRRTTAAAAVIAVLAVVTVSANAFGYDLWGKAATWTQEFFRFGGETPTTEVTEPDKRDDVVYSSLQEALDKAGITEKLAPTWFPDGYVFSDVVVTDSPREISVYANYIKENTELVVSIRRIIGSEPEEIEKSENLITAYDANGVTYYIFSNYEKMKAAWIVGEYECYITGELTIEEMKAIIDSI